MSSSPQAVVLIPTIGGEHLRTAVQSVLAQSLPTRCYVVCDGEAHRPAVQRQLEGLDVSLCVLPLNVGARGFYGHRIYAAFAHLVDEPYVLLLDQDNWFDPDHVQACVSLMERKALAWCYALRKVCSPAGEFLCNDDCESLGKWKSFTDDHLIDTSTYCLRREVFVHTSAAWHGGWGQDRVFAATLMQNVPAFDCSGRYTVNYRLGGNPGSVTEDFFRQGNRKMRMRHDKRLPWQQLG
jgi:hypothetical protein